MWNEWSWGATQCPASDAICLPACPPQHAWVCVGSSESGRAAAGGVLLLPDPGLRLGSSGFQKSFVLLVPAAWPLLLTLSWDRQLSSQGCPMVPPCLMVSSIRSKSSGSGKVSCKASWILEVSIGVEVGGTGCVWLRGVALAPWSEWVCTIKILLLYSVLVIVNHNGVPSVPYCSPPTPEKKSLKMSFVG